MRRLLAGLAGLALLADCGPSGPAASPSPPAQLTVADGGHSVPMRVGETIEVALQQQPGFSEWSHPTSTDEKVLAPVPDVRATPVRGMTLATFKAVARGRVDLRSASGADCSPGVACPAIARGWQAHVVVS